VNAYRWIYETAEGGGRRLVLMWGHWVAACVDPFPDGVPADLAERFEVLKRTAARLAIEHARERADDVVADRLVDVLT